MKKGGNVGAPVWREDLSLPPKLGCPTCPDFHRCGGLRVPGPAFDCTSFCDCSTRAKCTRTCRLNPYYLNRLEEILGFELWRLPPATKTLVPAISGYAPLLYHGSCRLKTCTAPIVALSFFQLFDRRTGQPRFLSREKLSAHYRISATATIVVTATEEDPPLERWWKLPSKDLVYVNMKTLGVALVTSPNFSVFNNVPYWDNQHNLKRIVLSWAELMNNGVPAALHINAHRDADYRAWREFVRDRRDVQALSVEFATGMGHRSRIAWHVEQLCTLAFAAGRPLALIVRGGLQYVSRLKEHFDSLLLIDTDPFVRTMQRSRGTLGNDFSVLWRHEPTSPGELLEERLAEAIRICDQSFRETLTGAKTSRRSLRATTHKDNKTRNTMGALQDSLLLPTAFTVPSQDIVAASEANKAI